MGGKINNQGIAEISLYAPNSPTALLDGKITGPNTITGVWKTPGVNFGHFSLTMGGSVPCLITKESSGQNFSDIYHLNFDTVKNRVQAIGFDQAGYFIVDGKLKNKGTKARFSIKYLGKFEIFCKCKLVKDTRTFEGNWSNDKGLKGVLKLTEASGVHTAPAPMLIQAQNSAYQQFPVQQYNAPQTYAPPALIHLDLNVNEPAGGAQYPTIQEIPSKPHAKGPSN